MKALPPGKTGRQRGKTGPRGQFAKGYDPRRGHGAKGRSGRKRNEFLDRIEALVMACQVPEQILSVVTDAQLEAAFKISPTFYLHLQKLRLDAWNSCADRVYQRPRQEAEGIAEMPEVVEVTRKLTAEEWREQARQYARAHFPDRN